MGKPLALITGGVGNLGRVVCEEFLRKGYVAVVPWRSEDEWGALKTYLGAELAEECDGIKVDLTVEKAVAGMVEDVAARYGRIDALINLAGGFSFGKKVWQTDLKTWREMLDVNLTTAFLCCKHVLPLMLDRGRGAIVNVSSKACVDIQPGSAAYAVSKAGIITLTEAIREEAKGTGIRCNAIMPSIIDTSVTRKIMPKGDFDCWVKPAEISDVLVALCSGECDAVDGSVLKLFGGL